MVKLSWKFNCEEVRTPMFIACIAQSVISVIITIIGITTLSACDEDHFGDWAMTYGALFFATSSVSTTAIYGRQRRVAVTALIFGMINCLVVMIIDGVAYFCVDLRGGINRDTPFCVKAIQTLNSCAWAEEWGLGRDYKSGATVRFFLLIFVLLHLVCGIGIVTTAMTEAGRIDLCQFEDAVREFKKANEGVSHRKLARRHHVLAQYISQAKPEEEESCLTRLLRYFGFGADMEPVPVSARKVKLIVPKSPNAKKRSKALLEAKFD